MLSVLKRRFALYNTVFSKSIQDPEGFWKEASKGISWDKPFTKVLDSSHSPLYRWFPDGKLNMCYNCLDRHVLSGQGHNWGIIYDSPLTNCIVHYTYEELLEETQKLAGAMMYKHGIKKGDRVVIFMPMIPEAVISMLACARIGAIHSVVFAGFSAKELANRISESKAKLLITANAGVEPGKVTPFEPIVNEAVLMAESNMTCAENIPRIVVNRHLGVKFNLRPHRDHDFHEELMNSKPFESVVSVNSYDPLYILHTTGSTGKPKGIIRDTGGYAVALDNAMKWVYGINRGDVFWSAGDLAWVAGHTCSVYGPLLRGATSVLYEGKPVRTPDAGAWWRVIQQHEVKSVLVAPTGIRAIKKEDPSGKLMKKYNLDSIEHFGVVGERCDSDTLSWLQHRLPKKALINDQWWQTESGWPMISNQIGLEKFATMPGSATKPVPGWNIQIIKDNLQEADSNVTGKICVKLPTPPGFMLSLWENDEEFKKKYMTEVPGYYLSGDEGFKDDKGYFHIVGRTNDVINISGHRFRAAAYEESINFHPNVAECAVIGVIDEIRGEIPIALIVIKEGSDKTDDDITHELISKVRQDIGAVASLKTCIIVNKLPKTKDGKVPRLLLKKMANGDYYPANTVLENPEALEEIKEAFEKHGYPKVDYNLKE
ncbi:unnamed protein product [Blepharisma stoltei]|uniref:Propionate--CoA ligase n=1 Tax=Blepharisma stoltei TaxID=1481888 RepID=A0AAU9IN90_9CILI|nr:unnamed protein product [Blepharisma stoltei]